MKRKYGGLKKKEGGRKRVDGMDFFGGWGMKKRGLCWDGLYTMDAYYNYDYV